MRIWRLVVDVVIVFSVTLVTSLVVNLLWNVIAHKTAIDWETSIRFAIVLGIIVPWIQARRGRQA